MVMSHLFCLLKSLLYSVKKKQFYNFFEQWWMDGDRKTHSSLEVLFGDQIQKYCIYLYIY